MTEDDKSEYEVHSRFCFRSDLIKFLRRNGKLPPFDLDGVEFMMKRGRELVQERKKMIKREQELVQKQKEMSEENAKLIGEIKMLRADQSGCCQLF